jgi:hypothetical protein
MNHLRTLAILAALGGSVLAWSAAPVLAADPSASPPAGSPAAGSPAVPADPKFGIGAGPSEVVLGATDQTGDFTVFNASDVEVTIKVTAYDFLLDSSGKRTRSAVPLPVGLATWVTFEPATFNLQPGKSQVVNLTVTRPTDATPGDHYAVVEAGGTVSDAVWEVLRARAGGTAVIRSRIAFPVTMVTRVPGAIDSTLAAELSVPPMIFTWDPDYTLAPAIIDKGTVAASWLPAAGSQVPPELLVPTLALTSGLPALAGDALLYDRNKDGTPGNILVLPGVTRRQELILRDVPLFGSYDYRYTLPGSAADNRANITATGHFVIVSLRKVVLYVVLPLAGLLLLILLFLLRRRYNRVQRVKAEAQREREREQMRREIEDQIRREGR